MEIDTVPSDVAPFFERDSAGGQDVFVPQSCAASDWGESHMRGMAVSGLLAHAVETASDSSDHGLRPVRWSVDLFRAGRLQACTTNVITVREGRRLRLVDAVLTQDAGPVARASALFLRASRTPPADVWAQQRSWEAPPATLRSSGDEPRLYFSEGAGWTGSAREHQNAQRKQTWHFARPIVGGEPATPFQFIGSIADAANVVANWGDRGLTYVNADLTLTMTRLPVDLQAGLAAVDRTEHDGLAAAELAVFDRDGPIGSISMCSIANAGRAVDPRNR